MQEHHWIKQEYIKSGEFPFLTDKWLTDSENLSTIIGHVGSHKAGYNDMVYKHLKRLSVILQSQQFSEEEITSMVRTVIKKIRETVPNNIENNILNNQRVFVIN